jgi:hypothetical protein
MGDIAEAGLTAQVQQAARQVAYASTSVQSAQKPTGPLILAV